MQVEIVYALPDQQTLLNVDVVEGCTVEQAIINSGILQQHPEIDLTKNSVGIFSKKVKLDHIVQAQDRIEIYRPLKIDPKKARKKRV